MVKARGSNEKYRTNAVKLIAAVLVRNGHDFPRPKKEIEYLQEFFIQKIRDVFTIGPAFKGILALMTIYKNHVNIKSLVEDLLPVHSEETDDTVETKPFVPSQQ